MEARQKDLVDFGFRLDGKQACQVRQKIDRYQK
jgi:hypothetical protein